MRLHKVTKALTGDQIPGPIWRDERYYIIDFTPGPRHTTVRAVYPILCVSDTSARRVVICVPAVKAEGPFCYARLPEEIFRDVEDAQNHLEKLLNSENDATDL